MKIEIFSVLIILTPIILSQQYNNTTDVNETYTLPSEILGEFALYESLEEYNKTCAFENTFESLNEVKLKSKIINDNCVPNQKTFIKILEAGWLDLSNYVIKNVYLPNLIDPTHTLYTYINKYNSELGKLKYLLENIKQNNTVNVNYNYENFDNKVKITVKLLDPSYVVEYLSIFCYKDLLKINGLFKSRQSIIRIEETKNLFDVVETDCEHNYNSYDNQIEIAVYKVNKFKLWATLFK